MIKKNIAGTVAELVAPVAEEMDIILWDVEFVKEGSKKILRITIDSEEGIDINICEKFHRTIDPMLDEADPIDESYYLPKTVQRHSRVTLSDFLMREELLLILETIRLNLKKMKLLRCTLCLIFN